MHKKVREGWLCIGFGFPATDEELFFTLLSHAQCGAVLNAIAKLSFLQEEGSGIAFIVPVQKVATLK